MENKALYKPNLLEDDHQVGVSFIKYGNRPFTLNEREWTCTTNRFLAKEDYNILVVYRVRPSKNRNEIYKTEGHKLRF